MQANVTRVIGLTGMAVFCAAVLIWTSPAHAQCNVVVDIGPNDSVSGSLSSGDCTIQQLLGVPGDISFVDQYRVTLLASGTLTIDMVSPNTFQLDPWLWLFNENLTSLLAVDDDGGVGFNARISIGLAPGTYMILANSAFPTIQETGPYTLTTNGPAPPPPSANNDFNADGRSDILWRNTGTGGNVEWQMNGFAVGAAQSIGAVNTAWDVADLGDFDGDGNADILWRNTSDGGNVMWLMDGFTRLGSQALKRIPIVWQVAGVGDFDGDDKADVLWRNTSDGSNVMWLMDGFTRLGAQGIKGVPTVWEVARLGDYNGGGTADILWRNPSDGSNVIWLMNGFTQMDAQGITKVPSAWQVE